MPIHVVVFDGSCAPNGLASAAQAAAQVVNEHSMQTKIIFLV